MVICGRSGLGGEKVNVPGPRGWRALGLSTVSGLEEGGGGTGAVTPLWTSCGRLHQGWWSLLERSDLKHDVIFF